MTDGPGPAAGTQRRDRPRPPGAVLARLLRGVAAALLLAPPPAAAQFIGLGNLLNPEGSRLFPQTYVFPRHPGKPDPRWTVFEWRHVDRAAGEARYRLHFDAEAVETAETVAPRIDAQARALTAGFGFAPPQPFEYVLFNSQREFAEANIFYVSEGVQGITSTTEESMAIPYWGELRTFDHISAHEMTHQFQVQKINALAKGYGLEIMSRIPLWFIEGMAEYYSLGGMDAPSRQYIRDALLHPEATRGHLTPSFFQAVPLDFVQVYKFGQARIHFLERRFGAGTAQRLLDEATREFRERETTFEAVAAKALGVDLLEIQADWTRHLRGEYLAAIPDPATDFAAFERIEAAGDTVDHFQVSPDGRLVGFRGLDPLIGRAHLRLVDRADGGRVLEVARDTQPGLLSLSFFQRPVLALHDDRLAFVVVNAGGPELEIVELARDHRGRLRTGRRRRVSLGDAGIVQASSPAFSPDGRRLTFVGLDRKSWENLWVLDIEASGRDARAGLRRLIRERHSWKDPRWTASGILAASDRADARAYSIHLIDPERPESIRRLTFGDRDVRGPDGDSPEDFVAECWQSDSGQIHRFAGGRSTGLTAVSTGLSSPRRRGDDLWALGFRGGRYGLYRIPRARWRAAEAPAAGATEWPAGSGIPAESTRDWRAKLPVRIGLGTANEKTPVATPPAAGDSAPARDAFVPDSIRPYRPFRTAGVRVDNVAGFFGSGTVGGLSATVSDLMRNYSVTGEFFALGSWDYVNGYLFVSSQKGRATWTTGGYYIIQQRLDNLFPEDRDLRTYLHREFGALGAVQYPLGSFSYVDATLRLGGVRRTDYAGDATRAGDFAPASPGTELLVSPVFRLGFDDILYEAFTGPIRGTGILLEADTTFFPERGGDVTERLRLDVSHYVQATSRLVLAAQGLAGASWGGPFLNPFFISSDDILRGYAFGDFRLLGNYVAAAKAEARYPIGDLFGFPPLRGLLAYDVGSVWRQQGEFRDNVGSSVTAGITLNLPPLALNFMSSYRIRGAPGIVDKNVFHFTFRYLYL